MAAQEENVLVIRDPSVEDENDWEEFSLVDVKVNLPNKPRYANVLTASEDNPLEVSGRLEEVEDSQKHLSMCPNTFLTGSGEIQLLLYRFLTFLSHS